MRVFAAICCVLTFAGGVTGGHDQDAAAALAFALVAPKPSPPGPSPAPPVFPTKGPCSDLCTCGCQEGLPCRCRQSLPAAGPGASVVSPPAGLYSPAHQPAPTFSPAQRLAPTRGRAAGGC